MTAYDASLFRTVVSRPGEQPRQFYSVNKLLVDMAAAGIITLVASVDEPANTSAIWLDLAAPEIEGGAPKAYVGASWVSLTSALFYSHIAGGESGFVTNAELDAAVAVVAAALDDHIADASAAHAASAVSVAPVGALAATDAQTAFQELDADLTAAAAALSDHISDATAAHAATAISNAAAGNISATTVQAAINELDTEKLAASSYTAADVLAKLLTVDGAGSGLDADLLDGQSSAYYLARANHTGTQVASTISDLTEAVQDVVGAILGADGGDLDFTYDDSGNSLGAAVKPDAITNAKLANMAASTIKGNNTGGASDPADLTVAQAKALLAISSADVSDFTEATQDVVGTLLGADSGDLDWTYNDAGNAISVVVKADAVDNTKAANMAQATIKGRAVSAGTGNPTDLTAEQALDVVRTVAEPVFQVATRSAIKALAGATRPYIFLTEAGYEGLWYWDGANNSALVTADPANAISIPPNSATSGASGVWKRAYGGQLNLRWFDVNNTSGDYTGVGRAIDLANYLNNGTKIVSHGVATIRVDATISKNVTTDIDFEFGQTKIVCNVANTNEMVILTSNPAWSYRVRVDGGQWDSSAITTGAGGSDNAGSALALYSMRGGWSIKGGRFVAGTTLSGLKADTAIAPVSCYSGTIENCYIRGWGDVGIYVTGGNALDGSEEAGPTFIRNCTIEYCLNGISGKRGTANVSIHGCKIVRCQNGMGVVEVGSPQYQEPGHRFFVSNTWFKDCQNAAATMRGGDGMHDFSHCVFEDWGYDDSGSPVGGSQVALDLRGTRLSNVHSCRFRLVDRSNSNHIGVALQNYTNAAATITWNHGGNDFTDNTFEGLSYGIRETAGGDTALLNNARNNRMRSVTNEYVALTTGAVFYNDGQQYTFTPAVAGTSTAGTGTYTGGTPFGWWSRVGDTVFFQAALVWSAHTGTGNIKMTGLPFTSRNGANNSACSIRMGNMTRTDPWVQAIISGNSTEVSIEQVPVGGSIASIPLDTAATLWVSGTYFV